jgi:hypothetical protein
MNTHLNYWAILAAAVSMFVLGGLLYRIFFRAMDEGQRLQEPTSSGEHCKDLRDQLRVQPGYGLQSGKVP